jgi:hypothetical protein
VLARAGFQASEFDFTLPQKILADYARERGLPFIDLLPPLLAAEQTQGRTYKPRDTHWNRLGNRVATGAIADAMAPILKDWVGKAPSEGKEPSAR